MGPLKVLIVGFGNLGKWHLKGLELARMGLQIDVVDKDPVTLASGNEFISNMILPELAATVTV